MLPSPFALPLSGTPFLPERPVYKYPSFLPPSPISSSLPTFPKPLVSFSSLLPLSPLPPSFHLSISTLCHRHLSFHLSFFLSQTSYSLTDLLTHGLSQVRPPLFPSRLAKRTVSLVLLLFRRVKQHTKRGLDFSTAQLFSFTSLTNPSIGIAFLAYSGETPSSFKSLGQAPSSDAAGLTGSVV